MIALIDFLDFQGFMQMPVQKPLRFEYKVMKSIKIMKKLIHILVIFKTLSLDLKLVILLPSLISLLHFLIILTLLKSIFSY